jgi:hypothetical protein
MDTASNLKWGLRLFFWIAMTASIRQGSLFAIALCAIVFLLIEYFLEDLEVVSQIK